MISNSNLILLLAAVYNNSKEKKGKTEKKTETTNMSHHCSKKIWYKIYEITLQSSIVPSRDLLFNHAQVRLSPFIVDPSAAACAWRGRATAFRWERMTDCPRLTNF